MQTGKSSCFDPGVCFSVFCVLICVICVAGFCVKVLRGLKGLETKLNKVREQWQNRICPWQACLFKATAVA